MEAMFLDSGAIYALADASDLDHGAVRGVYADAARRFVTHELILVEVFSLITKRLHKAAAINIVGALRVSPRLEIVPLTPGLLSAGWDRCRRFADKDWDWIDRVSFELMNQRGLREALSLDRHFVQAGFTAPLA
jgi:predicted nucleic acid-binding protein